MLLALIQGQSSMQQSENVFFFSLLFGWEETEVWCASYSRGWIIDRGQRGSRLSVDVTWPPSLASLHTKLQLPAPYTNDPRPTMQYANDPKYATEMTDPGFQTLLSSSESWNQFFITLISVNVDMSGIQSLVFWKNSLISWILSRFFTWPRKILNNFFWFHMIDPML